MKDFITGMAVGAAIAGAMCCPAVQKALKDAEQKLKEVADKAKSKKSGGEAQSAQNSNGCCECGCDCDCCENTQD